MRSSTPQCLFRRLKKLELLCSNTHSKTCNDGQHGLAQGATPKSHWLPASLVGTHNLPGRLHVPPQLRRRCLACLELLHPARHSDESAAEVTITATRRASKHQTKRLTRRCQAGMSNDDSTAAMKSHTGGRPMIPWSHRLVMSA